MEHQHQTYYVTLTLNEFETAIELPKNTTFLELSKMVHFATGIPSYNQVIWVDDNQLWSVSEPNDVIMNLNDKKLELTFYEGTH